MKTTLDIPDHLITEVKIRAAKESRKMKDIIAEALEKGLQETKPVVKTTTFKVKPLTNVPFPKSLEKANFNHLGQEWDDEETLEELAK